MNRSNDQGLGLLEQYNIMFLFCTTFFCIKLGIFSPKGIQMPLSLSFRAKRDVVGNLISSKWLLTVFKSGMGTEGFHTANGKTFDRSRGIEILFIQKIPLHSCSGIFLEVPSRFELENKGFADLRLTTWLWHQIKWSGRRDSDPRHPPWQGGTLPTELLPHNVSWGGIEPPTL